MHFHMGRGGTTTTTTKHDTTDGDNAKASQRPFTWRSPQPSVRTARVLPSVNAATRNATCEANDAGDISNRQHQQQHRSSISRSNGRHISGSDLRPMCRCRCNAIEYIEAIMLLILSSSATIYSWRCVHVTQNRMRSVWPVLFAFLLHFYTKHRIHSFCQQSFGHSSTALRLVFLNSHCPTNEKKNTHTQLRSQRSASVLAVGSGSGVAFRIKVRQFSMRNVPHTEAGY